MFHIFFEEERQKKLQDPKTAKLINAYLKADFDRTDEMVYSRIRKQLPEFDSIYHLLVPKDFLEELKKEKELVRTIENLQPEFFDLIFNNKENKSYENSKFSIESYKLVELHKIINHTKENFYINIANSINQVAKKNSTDSLRVVQNLPLREQAFKGVFVYRMAAESYLEISNQFDIQMIRTVKYLTETIQEKFPEIHLFKTIDNLVKSFEIVESINKEVWDFKMKEFDRIYQHR